MKSISVLLFFAFGLASQVLPDHYIVELSTEPVARVAAKERRKLQARDARYNSQRSRIRGEQQRLRREIEGEDATVLDQFDTVHNALVVRMSRARAERVRSLAGVKQVRPVRMYKPLLDRAVKLQKVAEAWQQIGGAEKAGRGVKIAILDTGIDASHPAFANSALTVPEGFPRVNAEEDRALTNGKVIVARGYRNPRTGRPYSARDVDGHGTSVAMSAAGENVAGSLGPLSGVAPGAWLGNYNVFPTTTGAPDSIIIRAIEDAVNDGMDVINLSLGAFPAVRPSDDELVMAVENAVAAGKVVVVAAGNDGGDPNTMGSPATAPSAIGVGSSGNDRIFAASIQVAGRDPIPAFTGNGRHSRQPLTATLVDAANFDPTGLACSSLPADSLKGTVVLILRGVCFFEDKLNNAQAAGAVGAVIYTDAARPDAFSFGVDTATLPALMLSFADGAALKARVAAEPALSVTLSFELSPVTIAASALSGFSSRGPSSDYGIKPDMLAVGADVYTARPGSSLAEQFEVASGTSYSSPMVAGAAAILIGARPGLTAAQYRSLLVNGTSSRESPTAVQSGGSGVLQMLNALTGTVTATPVSLSFGAGGRTVDQTKRLTITNLGATADTFSITAQPIGDAAAPAFELNSLTLQPGQSQEIQVRFSGAELRTGTHSGFIAVQGTQGTFASRIPYWYGIPSQRARYLQIFEPTDVTTAGVNTTQTIFFRFLDVEGIPVTDGVSTSIVSGGATAVEVGSDDDDVPGGFWVDVKMPAAPGTITVRIELNGVGKDVTFRVT